MGESAGSDLLSGTCFLLTLSCRVMEATLSCSSLQVSISQSPGGPGTCRSGTRGGRNNRGTTETSCWLFLESPETGKPWIYRFLLPAPFFPNHPDSPHLQPHTQCLEMPLGTPFPPQEFIPRILFIFIHQFSSVTQLCPTLCDPMGCSTPSLPVHHQLPEFTQTHVH